MSALLRPAKLHPNRPQSWWNYFLMNRTVKNGDVLQWEYFFLSASQDTQGQQGMCSSMFFHRHVSTQIP